MPSHHNYYYYAPPIKKVDDKWGTLIPGRQNTSMTGYDQAFNQEWHLVHTHSNQLNTKPC
jgi:hypothetical protein